MCTITIKGMGYYAGTKTVKFRIVKKDLSAWDGYIVNAVIEDDIVVEVDEKDVSAGGAFASGITFDDAVVTQTVKDDNGNDVTEEITVKSPLARAANGKIYTVGTETSGKLVYGTHFTASYPDGTNVVDLSKMVFDENGYGEQTATAMITGITPYTGSKTFTFTIRVKKGTAE